MARQQRLVRPCSCAALKPAACCPLSPNVSACASETLKRSDSEGAPPCLVEGNVASVARTSQSWGLPAVAAHPAQSYVEAEMARSREQAYGER